MANLDIIIRATDKGASKVLGGISKQLSGIDAQASKGFKGLQKSVGTGLFAAAGIGIAGLTGLAVAMRDSIGLATIQRDAEKQLAAVLESTGGAAGLTAEELKGLASSLQGVTNFGDEAIIAGESLLLTFTNIGGDIIPAATETMLDMSQALGQDMKSSAVQLGKALNDPITGITALSRVGVSFTDQQKEQIKAMQEAGDVAGAQKLILAELAKEFGGSARAMADPAIQLSNAWGDFKEIIGAAVLPILTNLAQRVMPMVAEASRIVSSMIKGFTSEFEYTGDVVKSLGNAFYDTFDGAPWLGTIANIVTVLKNIPSAIQEIISHFITFDDTLYDTTDAIRNILAVFMGWEAADAVDDVLNSISRSLHSVKDAIAPLVDQIVVFIAENVQMSDVWAALGIVIASIIIPAMASVVVAIAPVIAVAVALVAGVALLRTAWETDFGGIREFTGKAMTAIKEIIDRVLKLVSRLWSSHGDDTRSFLQDLWKTIEGVFSLALDNILEILDLALNILEGDWEGAWQNVLNIAKNLWEMLKTAWDGVLSGIVQSIMNIDWGGLGRNMVQGIIDGIRSAGGGIGAALQGTIGGLGANVGGTVGGWLNQAAGVVGLNGQANTNNYSINIQGVAGYPGAIAGASMDGILSANRRTGR